MTVTEEPMVVNSRVIPTPVLRYGPGSKEATIVSPMYRSIIGHLNDCHIVAPNKWAMEYVRLQKSSLLQISLLTDIVLGVTKGFSGPASQSNTGLLLFMRPKKSSMGPRLRQWQRHSAKAPKVLVGSIVFDSSC